MSLSKDSYTSEDGSDAEAGPFCGICREVGVQEQGKKFCIDCSHLLCTTCIDSHRKFKTLKAHRLVGTTGKEAIHLAKSMADCLLCSSHTNTTVEVVCKDHDVLCCLTCATVGHRQCREVVEITREAGDGKLLNKTNEAKDHLSAAKSYVENIMKNHMTSNKEFVSTVDVRLPKKLQDLKYRIIQALERLEKSIISDIQSRKKSHVAKHDAEISKWSKHMSKIAEFEKLLSSMVENGSDVHVYVAIYKIQKELSEVDAAISNLGCKIVDERIEMKETQAVQNILSANALNLVDVSVTKRPVQLPTYKYLPSMRNRIQIPTVQSGQSALFQLGSLQAAQFQFSMLPQQTMMPYQSASSFTPGMSFATYGSGFTFSKVYNDDEEKVNEGRLK